MWGILEEWQVERASQGGMSGWDGRRVDDTNNVGCAAMVRAEIAGKQEHSHTDSFLSIKSMT